MEKIKELVQWKTSPGPSITKHNITITPHARALTIRWPNGMIVWNRPVFVMVEQNNIVSRLPVRDVTKLTLWSLWGLGLLALLFTFTAFKKGVKK